MAEQLTSWWAGSREQGKDLGQNAAPKETSSVTYYLKLGGIF
jgi:hypothetical protein